MSQDEHYLKTELYALVRKDSAIFEFLQSGSLDGIWYWDLDACTAERFDGYLSKPFRSRQLFDALHAVVSSEGGAA